MGHRMYKRQKSTKKTSLAKCASEARTFLMILRTLNPYNKATLLPGRVDQFRPIKVTLENYHKFAEHLSFRLNCHSSRFKEIWNKLINIDADEAMKIMVRDPFFVYSHSEMVSKFVDPAALKPILYGNPHKKALPAKKYLFTRNELTFYSALERQVVLFKISNGFEPELLSLKTFRRP